MCAALSKAPEHTPSLVLHITLMPNDCGANTTFYAPSTFGCAERRLTSQGMFTWICIFESRRVKGIVSCELHSMLIKMYKGNVLGLICMHSFILLVVLCVHSLLD